MSAFEDFVNLELPRRPVMLTQSITGFDGDPNTGGPPALVANAPLGSFFLRATGTVLYKKNSSSPGTWEIVGGGGTDTTETVDRTLYVDAATGNDSNDGLTPGTALLTIAAARARVFTDIAADITIKLAAGTYTEYISDFRNFRADPVTGKASLLFEGDFADFTPATGPASGTFDVSFGTPYIPNTAVLTGATWTVDNLKGAFVEVLSGTEIGKRFPIASNTASTLDIGGPANTASAFGTNIALQGIAFKFVKPSVVLLHPLTTTGALAALQGSTNKVASGGNGLKARGAFQFYGIAFRATTARGLVQALIDTRVESCVFDQADTASLPTATSFACQKAGTRNAAINCFFGAAVVANTQITHINCGSSTSAGLMSSNFCVLDLGFTGVFVGIGAQATISNILIQGPRSTAFSISGGSGSQTGGMVIRNAPTAFAGVLFGSNPNSSAFLFTSQTVANSTKIYNMSVGIASSGLGSSSQSAIRNMIVDGCVTGVWIGSPNSQLVFQNSQIINNTGFGVRLGPGFTTGADPYYSGFSFAPGGLTMSGNVSGDLTFDGVTAITPATVSAQPDKTLINSRGNYFVGN